MYNEVCQSGLMCIKPRYDHKRGNVSLAATKVPNACDIYNCWVECRANSDIISCQAQFIVCPIDPAIETIHAPQLKKIRCDRAERNGFKLGPELIIRAHEMDAANTFQIHGKFLVPTLPKWPALLSSSRLMRVPSTPRWRMINSKKSSLSLIERLTTGRALLPAQIHFHRFDDTSPPDHCPSGAWFQSVALIIYFREISLKHFAGQFLSKTLPRAVWLLG
ncbi:hypothetical protein OIHEL45_19911 [Sulfitobacter indolifex HEL-45]|uniref:Uncharacterized protein n=1 Tax=Sulfitobacter indolifex HEL-45 TaxID=391624 RepID=A0ABM9X1C5_9RHOB|nr:hypothetical protein OIHEL45_19911 [Sulfitobacter indolifex HEL-45]